MFYESRQTLGKPFLLIFIGNNPRIKVTRGFHLFEAVEAVI